MSELAPLGASPFDLAAGAEDEPAPPFLTPTRGRGALNEHEQNKLARHPFEVAAAVLEHYSKDGPEAMLAVPGEVERLKWVGLYPQRQGGDAFMLRIKVPGGVLDAAQARAIGLVASELCTGPAAHPMFGNNFCDLTTRQAVQLHWLAMASVPEIWRRFAAVGLTSVQACGDCARNVTSCQVSGVDRAEVLDALPVARAVSAFFTGNRTYANLPRKFKLSVTGCTENCARAEINDLALRPASLDGHVGFEVLAGGGLSDGERLASDLDLFVDADDAVEVCRAVAQLYYELGNREHRGLARMRYLVQELGVETFRAELVSRLSVVARSGATPLTTTYRHDHAGVHPQRQPGRSYVGAVVPVGRMTGDQLVEAARLAEEYGDGNVRLGIDQNFVLSGVADDRVADLLDEPLLTAFSFDVGPFTRGVAACTGNEFCRYAVTETKQQAVELARRLDASLGSLAPDSPVRRIPLRVHVSGCSASCAQPQIADVGLRGTVHKGDEALLEGYDLGFGGSLGPDAGFLRWVQGAVRVEDLDAAILRVASSFDRTGGTGESFASWSRRHDAGSLRDLVDGVPG